MRENKKNWKENIFFNYAYWYWWEKSTKTRKVIKKKGVFQIMDKNVTKNKNLVLIILLTNFKLMDTYELMKIL
ncbi:hypothetical protein GL981_12955 (plasmid) [Spiroplasma citri]|nr:hypothetical protein GL981_12955 [Spiroplasma citri]